MHFSTSHSSHTTHIRAVSTVNQYVIYMVTHFVVRRSPSNLVDVCTL